jgi:hypothetical protein
MKCDMSETDKGRVINFLNQLLRGIAFIPALVSEIEGLLGGKSGAQKKDAAMSFLENALQTIDAVAAGISSTQRGSRMEFPKSWMGLWNA